VKSKSLLEYIYMGIILDLLEYIHVNKDPNTMAKKGKKHIRESEKNTSMKLAAPYFLQNRHCHWCLVGTVVCAGYL
jgi:hypothetical protein